ncbi:hypothetical protein L6452_15016 [Arctium lappa]|uniref:Uncharacterized protein n=1 Tax=Arctium lappa TaxID=4217 RepID=A0ACB9CMU2_ARCLA|nr:hypothetical protein L6452_15016 [Arctium lappa]
MCNYENTCSILIGLGCKVYPDTLFLKNLRNPNEFPIRKQVLDAGRVDLVNSITKTGGWLMDDFGLGVFWRYDAYNPYSGSISSLIKLLHPLGMQLKLSSALRSLRSKSQTFNSEKFEPFRVLLSLSNKDGGFDPDSGKRRKMPELTRVKS